MRVLVTPPHEWLNHASRERSRTFTVDGVTLPLKKKGSRDHDRPHAMTEPGVLALVLPAQPLGRDGDLPLDLGDAVRVGMVVAQDVPVASELVKAVKRLRQLRDPIAYRREPSSSLFGREFSLKHGVGDLDGPPRDLPRYVLIGRVPATHLGGHTAALLVGWCNSPPLGLFLSPERSWLIWRDFASAGAAASCFGRCVGISGCAVAGVGVRGALGRGGSRRGRGSAPEHRVCSRSAPQRLKGGSGEPPASRSEEGDGRDSPTGSWRGEAG